MLIIANKIAVAIVYSYNLAKSLMARQNNYYVWV